MTDDPPAGVSVLFFQVSLTGATLQSTSGSSVSLLANNTPIQVDVTQLQALSAFLSTASVPAGTYSSLNLTFANPQIVIQNTSDSSIAGTCAVGAICQFTPAVDNSATISLSSNPFPVTVAANSPLGFLIDFHLNTIIQSDLSVNLNVANGVTLAQLPSAAPAGPPQFGVLAGAVQSLNPNQNQFTLQTAWGRTFTIDVNSSTTDSDFPVCNTLALTPPLWNCIATGQIVQVQVAGIQSDGDPLAAQVTYLQGTNQQTVEGTIVALPALPTPVGETIVDVLLHQNPSATSGLPLGGIAQVAVWTAGNGSHPVTTFSIDSNGFTIPSGFAFAGPNDFAVGQDVQLTVTPGSLVPPNAVSPVAWGPPPQLSFTASAVQLEPSQITGTISSITSPNFVIDYFWSPCAPPGGAPVCNVIALIQFNVETTSQTNYVGFTPDSFSGLADKDLASVRGWLFPESATPNPTGGTVIVAQTVTLHPGAFF
jgi:hypothetical protein